MVAFISYNVDNDKRFALALDKAIKSVDDLRFPMGEISRDIFKNTIKNFILKTGGRYPALSPKYAKYKNKINPSAPILVLTGRLRDSVTKGGSGDSIINIGKQTLVQGTSVPYSRFVQEGTSKMPLRKYLFIDEAQAGRFERILQNYITAKIEVLGDVK